MERDNQDQGAPVEELENELQSYFNEHPEQLDAFVQTALSAVLQTLDALKVPEMLNAGEITKNLQTLSAGISEITKKVLPAWLSVENLKKFFDDLDDLNPRLDEELQKIPKYRNTTYRELLYTAKGSKLFYCHLRDSLTEEEREEARQDIEEHGGISEEEQQVIDVLLRIMADVRKARARAEAEKLPAVTYKKQAGLELSLDKLTTVFFGATALAPQKGQIPGQMSFIPVKYEKTGAPEITLYYNYSFDDDVLKKLNLQGKIDDEDYFILSFIASYRRAGTSYVSIEKLYRDMTGSGPNSAQKTELTNRLIKIASTNIFINDKAVRDAWGIANNEKTYKEILTPLAPIKIGAERFRTRGQVVAAGIYIYDEPDIMKLGYEMGQYTTVSKSLLHVKKKDGRRLNRTPRFYRILHYLIKRISAMKSGNLSHKILYDDLFEKTGESTSRNQQLAKDCMYTILEHFKACDSWITGYREETTSTTGKVGVTIFCNQTKQSGGKKKGVACKK